MYVMNKKWDSITNIAQCTSVYVGPEHEIKAVPTGGGNVYRLGQYETAEIARAVLNDLYMHISTGCVYQMPNDQRALVLARGMSDERPDKFAGAQGRILMTKRHHYNRKGQPQKRCNPDTCPNCMYIGEGDSWCDKIGEIVLSDWEPTDYYMGCCKGARANESTHRA